MSGSNKRSDILPVLLLSIVNKREYEWIEHYVSSKVRIPDAVARALPAPGELDGTYTDLTFSNYAHLDDRKRYQNPAYPSFCNNNCNLSSPGLSGFCYSSCGTDIPNNLRVIIAIGCRATRYLAAS